MARTRPIGHDDYDSVDDRKREGPSPPILETSAVADQHETRETAGGGEESETRPDEATGAGTRCRKTDEHGKEGQTEMEGSTTMKEEEADTEVGSTTSEGRNAKHAILSLEGQVTSVHSEEPQRVTDNDGRMKPSRDNRGTKDATMRCQDRQNKTRAIGMNGGLCLGKWRRCVENGGSRTVKRKRGIPKDVCGRAG